MCVKLVHLIELIACLTLFPICNMYVYCRSKDLESSCDAAALQGVGLQAVVTEYLITYADLIFSDKMPSFSGDSQQS